MRHSGITQLKARLTGNYDACRIALYFTAYSSLLSGTPIATHKELAPPVKIHRICRRRFVYRASIHIKVTSPSEHDGELRGIAAAHTGTTDVKYDCRPVVSAPSLVLRRRLRRSACRRQQDHRFTTDRSAAGIRRRREEIDRPVSWRWSDRAVGLSRIEQRRRFNAPQLKFAGMILMIYGVLCRRQLNLRGFKHPVYAVNRGRPVSLTIITRSK